MINDVIVMVWYGMYMIVTYGLSLNQSLSAQACLSMVECWKNHVGSARSLKVWSSRLPMRHSSKTLQVCSGPRHPSLGNRGVWDVVGEVKPTQFSAIQLTSMAAWVGLLLWLGCNPSIFPQYVNSLKQGKYIISSHERSMHSLLNLSLKI